MNNNEQQFSLLVKRHKETIYSVCLDLLQSSRLHEYRQNMRDRLLNDSLTEVVKDLITLKQQNLRVAYLSIVASIAWISVLFYETWDDISHNAEHCIIVCLILFFVSYSVSSRIQKTHRTINHLLRQIQEVK